MGGEESEIRVALADPDPFLMEELRKLGGPRKKVRFALANPLEIEKCFKKFLEPYSTSFYR